LHKAADAFYGKLSVAIRYAFVEGRKAIDKKNLYNAPQDAEVAVYIALGKVLPGTLLPIVIAGGDAGLQILQKQLRTAAAPPRPPKTVLKINFDPKNPDAAKWAREHAAELAKNLSETTAERVREAIAGAFEGDGDPEKAYAAVLEAVGDEARADIITRTELLTAANEGQRQGWDQAVDEGLLPSDARRVWITTEVGACPLCEDLDGESTTLDGEYPDEGGNGPPRHPNCRCTEGIV
jgi:hypothetical protein